MAWDDTITALATPPGEGGIAVIRLSGPESLQMAGRLFVNGKRRKVKEFRERYLYYGFILDQDQNTVDEVLLVYMKAPRTYTREDVVEIHCHGGMIPVRKILDLLLQEGARLAQPGEFTKRAFLNGRIDLAQAEGVMDLISSKSEEAARSSLQQMEGSLSREIKAVRDDMLDVLARIEVTVDYPEEDIEGMVAGYKRCHRPGAMPAYDSRPGRLMGRIKPLSSASPTWASPLCLMPWCGRIVPSLPISLEPPGMLSRNM